MGFLVISVKSSHLLVPIKSGQFQRKLLKVKPVKEGIGGEVGGTDV